MVRLILSENLMTEHYEALNFVGSHQRSITFDCREFREIIEKRVRIEMQGFDDSFHERRKYSALRGA